MKYIGIFTLLFTTHVCFSQNYSLTETDFGYTISDSGGQPIFPDYFASVYECENAPDFLIGINDAYDRISLLNIKKKTSLLLAEYESALQISEKCMLTDHNYLRFYQDKSIGLLKFPDSLVIPANYKMIYPFEFYAYSCILFDGKKYAIYDYRTHTSTEWFEIYRPDDYMSFDDGKSYLEENRYFFALCDEDVKLMNISGMHYKIANTLPKDFEMEDGRLIPVMKNSTFGFLNDHGVVEIPFIYEDAGPFKYDGTLAFVKKNGKYGFIDNQNQILIPLIYDHAESYDYNYAKVRMGETEFYIDEFGDRKDGLLPKSNKSEKFGFVNNKNKPVITFQFDDAGYFVAGMAPVKKNGMWGYISQTGTTLLEFKFEEASDFSVNLAACKYNGKWGYIDFNGNFVIENVFDIAFSFDFESNEAKFGMLTEQGMKYGMISVSGNRIIEPIYDDIENRTENMYPVKSNNKWGFLNSSGKLIIDYRFEAVKGFDRNLAAVKLNGKWGFIDTSGSEIISFQFDETMPFRNDLCAVKIGDKWGFIDKTGKIVIKAQFEEADNFYGDKTEVKFNGRKVYINKLGQIVK